jgi:NAD-dependent SIR2 family protein deacetylase
MSKIIESITKKEINAMFPICNKCKNYIKKLNCKAFNTIPDIIIFGENDHSKPLPNQDNDIVFEPIDDGQTK